MTGETINRKKICIICRKRWTYYGHIDVTNVSVTAGNSGLQFLGLSEIKSSELIHQTIEINLTNTNPSVENGTGIFVGAFTNGNIKDILGLSVGRTNLKNTEIHADMLLADGMFEDSKFLKKSTYWNDKNVKAISNSTFTLTANQSTLEGRANIAKGRNMRFDLNTTTLNTTTWLLKTSTKE
ncbi:hypothetical protein NPX99_07315 [Bartonella sp. 220]|uniref:hypothetical protein n=1 Tax=Bartonella sp. 220B TaxID=2967260 RepID=UPI0022A9717F|nr:hypothetical protein [Bartonella sp. 220B]MCZ2159062.1 hypothetical protein [Bartonella sp. 220B]